MQTKHWIIIAVYLFVLVATNTFTYSQSRLAMEDFLREEFASEELTEAADIEEMIDLETRELIQVLGLNPSQTTEVKAISREYFQKMLSMESRLEPKYEQLAATLEAARFDEKKLREILIAIDQSSLDARIFMLNSGFRIRDLLNAEQRKIFKSEFGNYVNY